MSKAAHRLQSILDSIENVEYIFTTNDIKITEAIEDKILKPAMRMHIVKIAEQFSKLKDDNEFTILENFQSNDLKGLAAVRNFIAHDYDSIDDSIIEDVIRINLPKIKQITQNILSHS